MKMDEISIIKLQLSTYEHKLLNLYIPKIMKKLSILLLLLVSSFGNHAQGNTSFKSKPRYKIHLTTIQGNFLKGLLMQKNDSSLIIYPGKRKEWNKNIKYLPITFEYNNVQEIKLKRKIL
jgi:hypothetical protein